MRKMLFIFVLLAVSVRPVLAGVLALALLVFARPDDCHDVVSYVPIVLGAQDYRLALAEARTLPTASNQAQLLFGTARLQPDARPANRAGVRLRVKAPIRRVAVFRLASHAQGEPRHAGARPVERQIGTDRVPGSAFGA